MLTGEHILALLMEPSAVTYGEVLRCVVEHEDFNYHSSELRPLQQQVVAGDLPWSRCCAECSPLTCLRACAAAGRSLQHAPLGILAP
jgi:hypothetical protein